MQADLSTAYAAQPPADTGGGSDMTARQIIEARLSRSLGPIDTMPEDERRALYLLALQLQRKA